VVKNKLTKQKLGNHFCFHFVFIFPLFFVLVRVNILYHFRLITDMPTYLQLMPPAVDWLLQCISYKASEVY